MNEFVQPPQQDEPSQGYEKNLKSLQGILKLEGEQKAEAFQKFIAENLARFKDLPSQSQISSFYPGIREGFIRPDTQIYRSYMADPFRLDDPEAYSVLLETIDEVFHFYKSTVPTVELRQVIPMAVQHALGKYFGNRIPYRGDDQQNRAFYMDHTGAETPDISLAELRGKNIAVCAEKASLGNNFLEILGIDSAIVFSSESKLAEESSGTNHLYNVLRTKNGTMMADFTNPKIMTDEESGEVLNYSPAFYTISEEQYQQLKEGGSVEVEHEDKVRKPDGTEEIIISKRTYAGK